ncbi:S8 family peptidase [Chryseobacterium arthrosphaerae]|uniref:Peptidase S8/S53 domain-containing protein n=1 Tax=Chryseobacterium arthrosphaerae TaxID=651561 RepID=A0A1B8ZN40_9FLAO|nr:S8 family peptidase [Chryseobacterium arthrosphaerae]OCA72988.1 hypothetical protein BBI00_00920 [Chryseobacterium arthrosphaerae]
MNNNRKPILYKGEVYSKPVSKNGGGGPLKLPISYEEARYRIKNDIDKVHDTIRSLPETSKLPNEIVVCIRMHPDFSAKSYYPDSLFDGNNEKFGLQEVGSRIWRTEDSEDQNEFEESGKLFFVRGTEQALDKLKNHLDRPPFRLTKKFTEDVRKIVSIDLLSEEEQILGIPDDWERGCLEAVLHPFEIDYEIAFDHFMSVLNSSGVDVESIKCKQYDEGVTFISLYGDREVVRALSGYNPLRTLHPLEARDFSSIERGTPMSGAPIPPQFTGKSSIVVGVIDGGYIPGNPALDPYVESEDSVPGIAVEYYQQHGTQVTSAVLYGALNKYKNTDTLPEPKVSVKNFRVLSSDTSDPDLYEVIDAIEKIVPENDNIKIYNLSMGPAGPILDDHISRFTFACDLLIQKYSVLFCTAVGNDGHIAGYNRIQAPADMVNGLAVGAYSKIDAEITRAPYSCIGPGREGNKLKPDLSAFGGCAQNPIQLMGENQDLRILTTGTSFSSPLVSAASAHLVGYSNDTINSFVARVLLIHGVSETTDSHSFELGHGILPDDIQQLVTCPASSYTIIYSGEVEPGKFIELPIPWTEEIDKGKVNFRWTVSTQTNVDPQSPDDYSTSSVVTSFYPHTSKFKFKNGGSTKIVDVVKNPDKEVELLSTGWFRESPFPVSESGQTPYQVENDLRADFKWDSMDTRRKNKNADNVYNPMFHLHALERGKRYKSEKIKYTLVLTVTTPKSEVDLYSKVRAKYSALLPISLDLENRISVTS